MIIFRNFNLSRLLFVAGCSLPFRRGTEEKQCFSSLFKPSQVGRRVLRVRWRLRLWSLLPSLLRTSSQSQASETVDQSVSAFVIRKERAVLLRVESSVIRP
jgi:hypothetical protein